MGDDMKIATLASTDGWTRVVLEVKPAAELAATVLVTTRFWERGVPLADADLVPDADVRIRCVALDCAAVTRLAADVRAWACLPLAKLATTVFRGEYVLAASVGQTLSFRFDAGQRPGQVAIAVELGQERLTCQVRFSADVTVCAELGVGLEALLDAWQRESR